MSLKRRIAPPGVAGAVSNKHLVCGAGGSRAILASAGHIMACHLAGITDWESIGGISGGSIPAALLAAGVEPPVLIRLATEIEFSDLVVRHASALTTFAAFLLKDRLKRVRPRRGVLGSEKMGEFVDEWISEWPKNFWTMATVGHAQVLFTADGVYQYLPDGQCCILSTEPAPLSLAIRASCAIPGIIDAVEYRGRYLFDGALGGDGQCPVAVVERHHGASPEQIIACDVGAEKHGGSMSPIVHGMWNLMCLGISAKERKASEKPVAEGLILARPNVWSVKTLQFHLTAEQKWQGVLSGFQAAVEALEKAGLLSGIRLKECLEISADVERLKALAA